MPQPLRMVPMLLAILCYWGIGFPLAYVLGFVFDLGGAGVWTGLAGGLAFAAVSMNLRFLMLRPKPPEQTAATSS